VAPNPVPDPPLSLNAQLSDYEDQIRLRRPDVASAYNKLVRRLESLDRGEIGPKLGEAMPLFSMPDESGRLMSLDSLLRSGPVVISFNRGHWCPYCKLELRSLAANYDRIKRLGASVIAIMPDSAQFTTDYVKNNGLLFPVLSDIDLGYALSLDLIFWVGEEVQRLYQEAGVKLEKYHGDGGYFLRPPCIARPYPLNR
jgi:peroxiredoxin